MCEKTVCQMSLLKVFMMQSSHLCQFKTLNTKIVWLDIVTVYRWLHVYEVQNFLDS